MNPAALVRRAAIIRDLRAFFDRAGFLEVETAVRIAAPAPEPHIDCPVVLAPAGERTYLRASPELQMKKLLSCGLDRIYQLGPCFREGERGSRHYPEFTMLEWYRKDATYLEIAEDLEGLLAALARHAVVPPGATRCRRLTVREVYCDWAGWDPWAAWDQDRFDFDMATVIEPKLKELGGGIFLMDYPVQAASLSRIRGEVAERWEFYWNGMELANCFTELCDEVEQRRRFALAKEERRALGESDYPLDEEFFSALPRIGAAAGVALGVDRLVMVLLGATAITEVRAAE